MTMTTKPCAMIRVCSFPGLGGVLPGQGRKGIFSRGRRAQAVHRGRVRQVSAWRACGVCCVVTWRSQPLLPEDGGCNALLQRSRSRALKRPCLCETLCACARLCALKTSRFTHKRKARAPWWSSSLPSCYAAMKLKQLEMALQDVETFDNPKVPRLATR